MKESDVVRSCLQLLKLKGIMAWRNNTQGTFNAKRGAYYFHGMRGVPDILGILPGGRFLGVECKSEKGRQSPEQKQFEAGCVNAGGVYLLVHSAAELAEGLK